MTAMEHTIGVMARPDEHDAVREFFELFKTPWEFCRRDKRYRVLLVADGTPVDDAADLVIAYGGHATPFDHSHNVLPGTTYRTATVSWNGESIPIYGDVLAFASGDARPEAVLKGTDQSIVSVTRADDTTLVRIGYDLFREVRFLLTKGQPAIHATVPTLERHIALLRGVIVGGGVPIVEVPPVPQGHTFAVCLTHDLDDPALRFHGLDHTILGFLYRAVVGSVRRALRRKLPPSAVWRNIAAALRLPFVHLGWAKDFWSDFDRYLRIESGLRSTFFVIPVKGNPGRTVDGVAPRRRASCYAAADIAERIEPLVAAGSEIAVHGIDAWLDGECGSRERAEIARVAGGPVAGVRMHWLFFDDQTPHRLESAGFDYDSTFGYNETVGFRAGTLQGFTPLGARRVLEMPLSIMDTALFYPAYLDLGNSAAHTIVTALIEEAERYGGVLIINWHDRSLAPERLWDRFYTELVADLRRRRPWFATLADAAAWLRLRRAVVFESTRSRGDIVRVAIHAGPRAGLPGLVVRVYMPSSVDGNAPFDIRRPTVFTDVPLEGGSEIEIPLGQRTADRPSSTEVACGRAERALHDA